MAVSPASDDSSPRGKVVHGREGWLFLHRDTNRAMGQQSGEIVLTPHQLMQWRILLETRLAWVERQAARYVFMVAPNAASIYSELLPDGFTSSPHRPVHQLIDHLAASSSPVDLLYPDAELIALKQQDEPYANNDTHWRDPGAFRAYELLLDRLEPAIAVRRLSRDDVGTSVVLVPGDLGRQVDPALETEHVLLWAQQPRARVVSDNRVFNTGRMIEYECPAAEGTCVMFGDSFGYAMLPFLAESFGRLVFVHRPSLDFDLISSEGPAVVFSLLTERFLFRVPFDQPYEPTRVLAREKREAGEVLAPLDKPDLRPDVWPPVNHPGD
jgi:alginate O-acetyltransferase complex protein AlgJ